MTLAEQLHELRNNILRDTSDIIAGNADELWDDATLIRYIADAERKFARQTLCMRDGTTPQVTQVVLKNGIVTYPLHSSVMAVISARYSTKTSDLLRSGHGMVTVAQRPEFMSFSAIADFNLPPSDPIAYYTDETLVFAQKTAVTLSIYPPPGPEQAGNIVYMRVARLPLTPYGVDCQDRESEIGDNYELDVLEWAAYRAQRTFDADAGAPTTSVDHKKAFDDAVIACKRELQSKMFANIGYKYGQNGFTWER